MDLKQAIATIREVGTDGINCGVETEDIVQRLTDWSQRFEFEVTEIDHATVKLKLITLPTDLPAFCAEVYEFCPDTIDQGYGCLAEMIDLAGQAGQKVDPAILALADGLDPEAEAFGLLVMERDLPRGRELVLWWD